MKNLKIDRGILSLIQKVGIKNLIPDKLYLQLKYKRDYGSYISWNNPQRFDEKMQWLKLYYRKPIMVKLVDKYEVKKYVEKKIGAEYIIPTLNIYNTFDEIDFSKLPDQFVLKCTHDSGGNVICKNKKLLDQKIARTKIECSLKKISTI